MPGKSQRRGGRMQNYFPVPARYRVSGALDDEGEGGAKLVGIFFVVVGALTLARPVLSELRMGTILMLGALGVPALSSPAENPWVAVVTGALLLAVGAGIVLRKAWAYWVGMAAAVLLFVPAFPYVTLAGLLIVYVLWRGRPKLSRTATENSG